MLCICIICAAAAMLPNLVHARLSGNIENHGDRYDFYGYPRDPNFDYTIVASADKNDTLTLSYIVDQSEQYVHSCFGSGFLVNWNGSEGYFATVGGGTYYLKNIDRYGLYKRVGSTPCDNCGSSGFDWWVTPDSGGGQWRHVKDGTFDGEYITGGTTCGYGKINEYDGDCERSYISGIETKSLGGSLTACIITVSKNNMYKHDTGVINIGLAVQYNPHNCSEESHIVFKEIRSGVNVKAPTALFDFNTKGVNNQVDFRTTVNCIDESYDNNTPKQGLTYYWTVYKDGREIYSNQSVPPSLNTWGLGKYEVSLIVRNESGLFSDTYYKSIELVNNPKINIEPDKNTVFAGESVTFKSNGWYNCGTSASDLTIKNVVSDNLYNPSIFLVGANGMITTNKSAVKGDFTVDLEIEYQDKTKFSQQVTVPPYGLTIDDSNNKDKKVSNITIIYKNYSNTIDLKEGSYISYSFDTRNRLSDYYVGGVNPRKYEVSNSVTLIVNTVSGQKTANNSAKIDLMENKSSFSLIGTIDNHGAVTEPPKCNTEFLLTGTSIGGETISKYIVVSNGKSENIEIPYGDYQISEETSFALGYDDIVPMHLTIDDDGIHINKETIIDHGGEIPFTKVLQTADIAIERIYETENGIEITSDTDYKVALVGTPVVKDIRADFELISPNLDPEYCLGQKSVITLPIGSYHLEETQAYRLVSLKDITVADEVKWDRALNAKETPENGNASFIAKKSENIPIVMKYIADEYVYDEYIYENSIVFSVDALNVKKQPFTTVDTDKVLVSPSNFKYVIRLVNTVTGEDYCGIAGIKNGAVFKYMVPGEYEIKCCNNMYFNLDKLKEINSDRIDFFERNGKYYVGVPEDYANGKYNETTALAEWRGYSNIDAKTSIMDIDTRTHVSLTLVAKDQEKAAIPGLEIRFMSEDGPLYFIYKDQKWYPSDEYAEGAVSSFITDKYGQIEIYKFPEGEFNIEQVRPIENLNAVSLPQTILVDGTRNMGVKVVFTDDSKTDAPSSITLSALKTSIDINENLIISDTISPSTSAKNIVYSSTNNNVAVVTSDGIVTGKSVGKTVIKAISEKSGSCVGEYEVSVYNSANPQMVDLRQTISNIRLQVNESYKASIVFSPSTVKTPVITWASSNPTVASVSSDGLIKGLSVGIADITAECAGHIAAVRVTVGNTLIPAQGISLNENHITLVYNSNPLSKRKLSASVSPDNASDTSVTYVSSNPIVVSVDTNGNLIAKEPGEAVITASTVNGISASCVVSSLPIVEKINLNAKSLSLTSGSSAQITAVTNPIESINSGIITWKSSDESVVTVDEHGTITTKNTGKAVISAISSYPGADSVIAECSINVVDEIIKAEEIKLYVPDNDNTQYLPMDKEIEMEIGDTITFAAEILPSTATNTAIDWSYSRSNVVTIAPADSDEYNPNSTYNRYEICANGDSGGETTVTGKIEGTDTIIKFNVVVSSPGTGFELSGNKNITLVLGADTTFSTHTIYNNPFSKEKDITWSLSDENKAELIISEDKKTAKVIAKQKGSVTLTAEVEFRLGGKYTENIEVNIEDPRIDILVDGVDTREFNINKGESALFVYEPNCSKESADLIASGILANTCTFSDYDKHIVRIKSVPSNNTAKGWGYEIEGLAIGTTVIKVTPTSSLYSPVYLTVTVSGEESRVDSYFNGNISTDITINSGSTETITLKANCPNEGYEIHISDSAVADADLTLNESTLDGIITVSGLSVGTTTITITPKYTAISPFDITITVV